MTLQSDYYSFFDQAKPSQSYDWAGGKITMGPQGQVANWLGPENQHARFDRSANVQNLYNNNPAIKTQWDQKWGNGGAVDWTTQLGLGSGQTSTAPTTQTAYGGAPEIFQPDKFPTSNSANMSQNSNFSSAFGGLPTEFSGPLLDALLPQLMSSMSNLPNTVNQYTANAAQLYERMGNQMLKKSMPNLLNSLNSRNILDSSVASNAISGLGQEISDYTGNKAYEAGMQGANMMYGVPNILGGLVGLGKYNTSLGGGTGQSAGYSQSSDPLAPYNLLANFSVGY